ncbi:lysylphosphatidylglycerol synthase transmembrane domain-containing protein [Sphingobacterium sp. UT-1RO-CII-1]|uniref:lysylphosphatidylglycerol synthase transmembrane domain-containing protein n=1 Tax=Sphingobacterium sp. UT-1RO-CII-1 TaxID=2995225 RepID=UPI00227A178B|nr:lysylphosphatidylglycerol synthase transmembrane domain-containing protein [Sphingobacterium sp. UT-1RO-CII-1]MCY4781125.1 lysylphosphatidylglycerol synthase transmembrane domain-containing protein [Sphingobacterium sp. UT-1RO-CII-1]
MGQKERYWSIIKNIFKIGITITAIFWISRTISYKNLQEAIENCKPLYIFIALFCYIASQIIASSRLNTFLKIIGLNLTERYNLRLYQVGLLYNFFLPGGIGGDGYKVYFLKKNHQIKTRRVLSAVFFDRLSGIWALSIITGFLIIFMPRFAIPNTITISVLFVGTATYIYLLRLFFRDFLSKFITTHLKALMVQGFQTLSAIAILYSLSFDGKFSPYLLIFLLSQLVAIVPSILGGVGLRESIMSFGAVYLNLDPHLAVLLSLTFYIISFTVATSGIYYIFRPQRLGANKLPSASEVEKELHHNA